MKRPNLFRLASFAAGVAIVAGCDSRLPTAATSGSSSSSSSSNSGAKGPTISIDSPAVGTLINVGDSVLVTVHLHHDKSIRNAKISGVKQTGSIDLGTFTQTDRYRAQPVPANGNFRSGLRDTTIRRYLQPVVPVDTSLDSLVVVVVATDTLGVADTVQRAVHIVTGPKLTLTSPTTGDSIPAGVGISISAHATSPDGVGRIDIHVKGESTWPTKLDTTITQVFANLPRDVVAQAVTRVPADAPLRGRITITATGIDANRQPGAAAPVAVYVRSASSAQPRVVQTVSARSELVDSVLVRATGDGITTLGVLVRDSTGATVAADTLHLTAPFNANIQANVPLNLPPSLQGRKLGITAFAIDQAGRVGYAVTATRTSPEGNLANALIDSTLVVYGHTYALPHPTTVGDIAVDAARGNVFLSSTAFNLLDVWQSSGTSKGFAPTSIPVGSLPWGLFISNNPDTLLVANSGGTNISRVYIGSTSASAMREDLAHRILTRNTYNFVVLVDRDVTTGKIRMKVDGPFSYSDRPQYLAQSRGGRIFYSTRPTAAAPAGTIRWLDPSLPVPDPRQVWQYGTTPPSTQQVYALFNVDSVGVGTALPDSPSSDTLFLWDHPYGQATGSIAVLDTIPLNAVAKAVAGGSDAEAVLRLDLNSLALTDTTFAAASGNRQWIAFGEGHSGGAGRVMMIADSTGLVPNYFSPLVTISDLTDNASERVFGLALDLNGKTVASHGSQSYFAAVADPFHLRLQGKYDSFDDGAGIAFHPQADGTLTPQAQRLAFVGAASGQIEVVDVAYYTRRARLQLKNPIYGPIRASGPMPGDPADVIIKLYALTQQGFVVIDLTANDIKPGP